MILSFKIKFPWGKPTNFENKINRGVKIHSIREDRYGRWKVGRQIHMSHGIRTKNYRCFNDKETCKSVQSIKIYYIENGGKCPSVEIVIDGNIFYKTENNFVIYDRGMIGLARNDGFDSVTDFFKWFDHDFEGRIIWWRDFKY